MAGNRDGGRLVYADLMRVAAMLAVIVIHVSAGWLESLPVGTADWHALNLWDSLTRWAVPVFVMCSGMFLLDPKKSLSLPTLFFRHFLRLVAALLFWGTVYHLLYDFLGGTLSLESLPHALYAVVLGNTETHLWFLTMMMGLYLLTPLLRAFLRGASRGDLHWFFLLYGLFMLVLPLFLRLRGSQTVTLYANQFYLNFTLAFPPLAYVGYFVAGYYLKTYTLGRIAEGLIYLLGIAGAVATAAGTTLLSHRAGGLDVTLYSYLTPNVAAMAAALFVLFREVLGGSGQGAWRRRFSGMAACSFGVYLCHVGFLLLLRHFGLGTPPVPAAVGVPLLALAVFLPSYVLSWLLHKIPVAGPYLT